MRLYLGNWRGEAVYGGSGAKKREFELNTLREAIKIRHSEDAPRECPENNPNTAPSDLRAQRGAIFEQIEGFVHCQFPKLGRSWLSS